MDTSKLSVYFLYVLIPSWGFFFLYETDVFVRSQVNIDQNESLESLMPSQQDRNFVLFKHTVVHICFQTSTVPNFPKRNQYPLSFLVHCLLLSHDLMSFFLPRACLTVLQFKNCYMVYELKCFRYRYSFNLWKRTYNNVIQ